MIDLAEKTMGIELLETKILATSKLNFVGSYDHWNILNTLNHACCWKNSALRKVELRLDGEDSKFHSDEPLETINQAFYYQTEKYTKEQTQEVIAETFKNARLLIGKIKGQELSKELAPIGYNGDVLNYLICDLIYHPVNHYIYYAIKNNEYEVFLLLEQYINSTKNDLYKDLGILSIKGLIESNIRDQIFIKDNIWDKNKLYLIIKTI